MCSKMILMTTIDVNLVMFLLIIPFSVLPVFTVADPLDIYCSNNTVNYTLNSPFESNLKSLLETLPSITSLTGFNYTSFGESTDKVYGQALCRGDVNPSSCQACVDKASQEIIDGCRKYKDAIIWYELCQVQYSFYDMTSMSVYVGKYPGLDSQRKLVSDPQYLSDVLTFLMTNLSSEAAVNPSKLMFATGAIKFGSQTVYAHAQCTRNIIPNDCKTCLTTALAELKACCSSREGGFIVSGNCNMRFDLYKYYNVSSYLLTYPSPKGSNWKIGMVALAACAPVVVIVIVIGSCIVCLLKKRGQQRGVETSHQALIKELACPRGVTMSEKGQLVSSEDLPFMDLTTISAATENFSENNKLGEGGFGTIYKGVLPDGKEIAVKRLSRKSWQGLEEFKNEVKVIAKLQHRNLVKLLGCGIEGEEKLLIYEFMHHKSLDMFIFDAESRRAQLDWETCHSIASGIARGLVYLHEDSRLRIIHRDLKPSNVLLDHEMVAKISDFGMARIFEEDQNKANTRRVVGTFGYMAPEYAMEGLFSVKSDVFSFGVILLEIISGKRSSGFYLTEHGQTLLAYAWRLWNEGREMELVGPSLMERGQTEGIVRCIHVGLLCVQKDPADRPTMSFVVIALGSDPISLRQPKEPAFSLCKMVPVHKSSTTDPSVNQMTVSGILPR